MLHNCYYSKFNSVCNFQTSCIFKFLILSCNFCIGKSNIWKQELFRTSSRKRLESVDMNNLNVWSLINRIPSSTMEPTTTLPPPTIGPVPDEMPVTLAKVFAGVSVFVFVLAVIFIIIKLRRQLKQMTMSIPIVRDMRDISEFERMRRTATFSQRQAAEGDDRMFRDFIQLHDLDSDTVFPFLVLLKEDVPSPPPPSYETLFHKENILIKAAAGDSEDEEPPPRYSACYSRANDLHG